MDLQWCACIKPGQSDPVTQYINLSQPDFPHVGITECWVETPGLDRRALLIHFSDLLLRKPEASLLVSSSPAPFFLFRNQKLFVCVLESVFHFPDGFLGISFYILSVSHTLGSFSFLLRLPSLSTTISRVIHVAGKGIILFIWMPESYYLM